MKPAAPSFICASCARALRTNAATRQPFRTLSSKPKATTSLEPEEPLPRWKQTPPAMRMPVRVRHLPKQPAWKVNDSEEKLNEAYDTFLGRIGGPSKRGRDLLDEETKWIALTHKSHDHGRQGFNDRLAFLGKRIVDLQTSLALLSAPAPPQFRGIDPSHRFQHEALEGVENITAFSKQQVLDKSRLAQLASQYGIDKVVRWKPKKVDNLQGSGADVVMAHAIYSVVGAVALKQGGEVAVKMVRERLLTPLGLR